VLKGWSLEEKLTCSDDWRSSIPMETRADEGRHEERAKGKYEERRVGKEGKRGPVEISQLFERNWEM
jgi:hypothetical protein